MLVLKSVYIYEYIYTYIYIYKHIYICAEELRIRHLWGGFG